MTGNDVSHILCSDIEGRSHVISLAQSEPSKVLHYNKTSVSSKFKKKKSKQKRQGEFFEKDSAAHWNRFRSRSDKTNHFETNKREKNSSIGKRIKFEEKNFKTSNENCSKEETRLSLVSYGSYQSRLFHKHESPMASNSLYLPSNRFPYASEGSSYSESYIPSYHVLYHYHHHHHHHGQEKPMEFVSNPYYDQSHGAIHKLKLIRSRF